MDMYGYISAIALFIYAAIFLVVLASRKTRELWSFLWLLVTMVCWAGGSMLMRWQVAPSYQVWYHVSIAGLLLMACAYYRFLSDFVEKAAGIWEKIYLLVMAAIIAVNVKTGFFLAAPRLLDRGDEVVFEYTITWPVLLLFVAVGWVMAHSLYHLWSAYRERPAYRGQFKPVTQGIVLMFAGHAALLLPVFAGFPIDILAGVGNALLLFYALVKKRLFKLRLLASESVCYMVGLMLTFILFYNLKPYLMKNLEALVPAAGDYEVILFAVFFFVTAGVFSWLWRKLVNNVFVREENRQSEALNEYSTAVARLLNVQDILEKTVEVIREGASVGGVYVCTRNAATGDYDARYSDQPLKDLSFSIRADSPLVRVLRRSQCISWRQFETTVDYKAMWDSEKNQLRYLRVAGGVALTGEEGDMPGLILVSEGQGKHRVSGQDMQWMLSVASVASMALKNAALYEQAYHEARVDDLTGLLNRKHFLQVLEEQFETTRESTLALMIVNVDDFKLYNQLYGQKEGDLALRRIADIIRSSVGENGFVARYSGKEFAVLLPRYDVLATRTLAESIRDQVFNMNRRTVDHKLKVLTLSIGISAAPFDASTSRELMDNADMAVYHVKHSGKNGIEIFQSVLRKADGETEKVDHAHIYQEYEQTVLALMAAIDAKDHYTFSHSHNVAYYATSLAKAAGLNADMIEIVRQAALLHDIGKIGIPETVLNKNGKLTEEEYEQMQGHVEAAVGIIRYLPALDYIIPAVIGHHERYDGRGYPRRIGGEDIPLLARILCIADSFDAMTSKRCYKEAVSLERGIQILTEEAGRQFDPKLVPVFVAELKRGGIQLASQRKSAGQ